MTMSDLLFLIVNSLFTNLSEFQDSLKFDIHLIIYQQFSSEIENENVHNERNINFSYFSVVTGPIM